MVILRSSIRKKIAHGGYRRLSRLYSRRFYDSSTGPNSNAAGTLSTVRRSYRSSNPMLITPSNARSCSFWRSVTHSTTINQLSGFNGGSTCIGYAFNMQGVIFYLGGIYQGTINIANFSEFQALFDQYKINSVKMRMWFTNNNSSTGSPTVGMPLVHLVNDFDDIGESLSIAAIQEKAGFRTFQFDATNGRGQTNWVKPVPRTVVSQNNADTGVETVSSAGTPYGSTWLDASSSNIIHSGVKIVYNNQGRSTNVDIGSMTVQFEINYVFKGYR